MAFLHHLEQEAERQKKRIRPKRNLQKQARICQNRICRNCWSRSRNRLLRIPKTKRLAAQKGNQTSGLLRQGCYRLASYCFCFVEQEAFVFGKRSITAGWTIEKRFFIGIKDKTNSSFRIRLQNLLTGWQVPNG